MLRAFEEFDRDVRATFPDTRYKKYAISHAAKWYPPKEILRLATRCEKRDFVLGGGPNINRCFEQLGFTVVENWGTHPSTLVAFQPVVTSPIHELSATEGRDHLRLHRLRERDQKLVTAKKRQVLGVTHRLECEVCDFDFAVVYGTLGEGFAECHHRLPFSAAEGERCTQLADLAIVCANCHRMLHRRPWRTVEELRELVRLRRDM
jgi:HNH endonuclease